MKATCYVCSEPMKEAGGMIQSPPVKSNTENSIVSVQKYRICTGCWPSVMRSIDKLEVALKEKRQSP